MTQARFGKALRHIRQLVGPERASELSDAQLLEQFVSRREESAFAALLGRHGRLVWSVCRQVLHHDQDAEDAFQATFLVLAVQAASIRQGQAVSSWLYHVAHRIARKAEGKRSRQGRHERQAEAMKHVQPVSDLPWRELQVVLEAELQRLPEKYRAPFVLCCLEDKSRPEAARLLGWKEGTLSSRLAEARKRLQQRLARRGITLSAVLCATALAVGAGPVPAALARQTLRTAVLYATDKAAAASVLTVKVAALVEGVTKTMFVTKANLAAAFLLVAGLLAAGFSLLTRPALAARQGGDTPQQKAVVPDSGKQDSAPPAPSAADAKKLREEAVVVKGRVLDPEGKPLEGAKLYLSSPGSDGYAATQRATSDAEGRFEFSCAKAALAGPPPPQKPGYLSLVMPGQVMAVAKGYGCDWGFVELKDKDGAVTLQLVKDVPINCRILDQDGEPVVGAKVRLAAWYPKIVGGNSWTNTIWLTGVPGHDLVKDWLTPWEKNTPIDPKNMDAASAKSWGGPLPQQPRVLTTGADGRIRLTGLGQDRLVGLRIEGPRIVSETIIVRTLPGKTIEIGIPKEQRPPDYRAPRVYGAAFDFVAHPERPIRGVVRDKATGKPVAGVVVWEFVRDNRWLGLVLRTETDRDGKYELHGYPKSEHYMLTFSPPSGQHFTVTAEVADTKGFDPLTLNVDLPAGVPLQGRVTDKSTGKPIPQARVRYYAMRPNAHALLVPGFDHSETVTGADGTFTLVVVAGPGVLGVISPKRELYAPAVKITHEDEKRVFGKDWNPGRAFPTEAENLYFIVENARREVRPLWQKDYDALILLPVDEKGKSLKRDVALLRRDTTYDIDPYKP
jgi:RNA polymerase sigma factor (sigma-70 family)